MKSRERIRKALTHSQPDRVPIDLGGFQTGIHRAAYVEVCRHLGIDDPQPTILDAVQQLTKPCEALLERFRVDTRYVVAHGPESFKGGIVREVRNGRAFQVLRDEFGIVWGMPEDQQLYMDMLEHPLADASLQDVLAYPFPDGADPTRFSGCREQALRLARETPFAICTGIGGVVYEFCWYLRGLERWFMDLVENRELCEALLDRMLAFWTGYYTAFMKEVGDLVDVVMVGDDLAGQAGPLFSPATYRELVKPRQKALVQHIRGLTKAKVWYHTCGSCAVYIPDLIDNGVDILNPVQIGIRGMDPAELKARYGERLTFWGGGIDAQHVLATAGPAEVREHVRRNMAAFKPGGGYVFNNVHNIQAGVPAENVVALFDAAYEFGAYD